MYKINLKNKTIYIYRVSHFK